jgi:hypothetical protein
MDANLRAISGGEMPLWLPLCPISRAFPRNRLHLVKILFINEMRNDIKPGNFCHNRRANHVSKQNIH